MFEAVVVDDEQRIRTGISSFINNNDTGFEVIHTFKDGSEAIEHLKKHDVDLVITDIKMVEVSGIELSRYLYENKPNTRIILLSGYSEFEYAKAAIQYHVQDYLTKPTDFDELAKTLARIRNTLESAQNTDINIFLDKVKELYEATLSGKHEEAAAHLLTLLENNHHNGSQLGQFAVNLFDIIFAQLYANLKLQFLQDQSEYKNLAVLENPEEIKALSLRILQSVTGKLSSGGEDTGAAVTAKLIQYVNEHFSENISLQDAAEKVFFSPVYCSRFFKKQTGENFSDYLLRVRMENAVRLLRENKKITEISQACGYSSSGYFTRTFKEYFKCTPSEYMRKNLS